MNWRSLVPIVDWLPEYNGDTLKKDISAGITVAVILVPQGMAYAILAGLPPIYGLYAGLVPGFLYAFFGTSRQLSVGPVALVSLLVLSGLQTQAEQGSELFIKMAIATALLAGLMQIIFGLFRLGFLVNFLSHPVLSGFTSAAAIIIGMSQIKNLLGIELQATNRLHQLVVDLASHIQETHLLTVLIGLVSLVVILLLKKWKRAFPGPLLVVVLASLAVWHWGWHQQGIQIVGAIPDGLPSLYFPDLPLETFRDLIPLAFTICLISFIESLAIAKALEAKHKNYRVIPNQELIALGITKIGGTFFQAYPTTGSFSRSAINNEANAQTGISSIVVTVIIALTLLFLTPYFFFMPKVCFAVIIILAVVKLIDYQEALLLWKTDRRDFITLLSTFLLTLFGGIQFGILAGVLLSIAFILYRNATPHFVVLGRLPKTNVFRNIERFSRAEQWPSILILRFDGELYFANAEFFKQQIERHVLEKGEKLETVILDASAMSNIDSTGVHRFKEVLDSLETRNIKLLISGAIGPVRDVLFLNEIAEMIGLDHHFMRLQDALDYIHDHRPENLRESKMDALQNNTRKGE